ncbi:MAG: hypothetical protein LUQ33_01690 [Methanoregulaceae archaeon]|nr:hypothetical protein [Methanoregulaceae archaeon]
MRMDELNRFTMSLALQVQKDIRGGFLDHNLGENTFFLLGIVNNRVYCFLQDEYTEKEKLWDYPGYTFLQSDYRYPTTVQPCCLLQTLQISWFEVLSLIDRRFASSFSPFSPLIPSRYPVSGARDQLDHNTEAKYIHLPCNKNSRTEKGSDLELNPLYAFAMQLFLQNISGASISGMVAKESYLPCLYAMQIDPQIKTIC